MSTTPKKIRRRRPLRVAATTLFAASLFAVTACTGQGVSDNSGTGDSNADVTLTFWNSLNGPDKPAVEQVIKDFNDSQDKITVENNAMPSDVLYQKVLTAVTSSDGPDVIGMHVGRIPQFAQKGALQPLDGFYDSDEYGASDLISTLSESTEYDGANYGVPLDQATVMMYYNKDLFEQAGLDPEKPPTTWDEFAAMVPQLTRDDNGDGKPEVYAIALADHEGIPVWQPFIWNNGGDIVSEDGTTAMMDEPEVVEAVDYWAKLVRDQQASPIGLSGADADKLFQTGKAAIEIVGPWMTTAFDEAGLNYGITEPFAGPEGNDVLADVLSFTVSSAADDATRDAAYEFFSYWNSVEGQTTWSTGSGFPPNRTDIPADKLSANPYPSIFGAPEVVERARVLMPGIPSNPVINESVFTPALQRILNGEGNTADILADANKEAQQQLDQDQNQ
jgi:multiple sugar transport system substrate-binding protein